MSGALCAIAGMGGSAPPVSLTNTFTIPGGRTTYVPGDTFTFGASTGVTAFPVRNGTLFKITLRGAPGGGFDVQNQNGGILIATINLSTYQNTNLYFVRGGMGDIGGSGIDSGGYDPGGYNGGGAGQGSRAGGGGGRTDLRTAEADVYSELLVAGGGGGGYGSLSASGGRYQGSTGCGGYFGDYLGDNAGGGGGYYGGSASCGDDDSNGGAGTNYYNVAKTTTVHQDTRIATTTGGWTTNGSFIVEVIS